MVAIRSVAALAQFSKGSHVRRRSQAWRFDLHSLIRKAGMYSRLQGGEVFGFHELPLAHFRITLLIIAMAKIGTSWFR
jgi:hypothetical protein